MFLETRSTVCQKSLFKLTITNQFAELLDISIRFGPSGALVSKKVCVAASLGADSFEKVSVRPPGTV
jgi:hypothetical protein